ncbi:MAG TPA: FkbM family methyltransferase [Vicinamibacterales bacterium]|nr:FkbM family methyltransferase [Vicinamibacterales bacterium]
MIERPDDVVRAAYNLLLSRDPEAAGLRHWSSALQNGLSRVEFIRAVLASTEFRESMAAVEDLTKYQDVDLIIPLDGRQFRVPASDVSLVPHLLKDRCWEPHVMAYLTSELQAASVFMDVGANIGYFTVLCAPLVSRVVAFEPVARTAGYCEANIALNGLTNVELHRYGLWHEDARLQIRADDSSVMTASVVPRNGSSGVDSIEVVSLDRLFASGRLRLHRLDVVKMDAEGAELSALVGMRATLERYRPQIVMEINRPMLASLDATIDQVWDFLQSLSYYIRAFEAGSERAPVPIVTLDQLKRLCPDDTLIDIVAVT